MNHLTIKQILSRSPDGRLTIRHMCEEDLEDLFLLLSDQRVMECLEPLFSREQTEAFLQRTGLSEQPLIYAVEDADNEFIGYVIFHTFDDVSMEIGWVLKPIVWGRGYADQLTKTLVELAEKQGKQAVIECNPKQSASRRIAARNRFYFCGLSEGLEVYRHDPRRTVSTEVIGKTVCGYIDRPLGSMHPNHPEMVYPINYGYVQDVLAADGEGQDVYVLGADRPLTRFEGKVIAVYHRFNDLEDKWIVATDDRDYSDAEILQLIDFQEKYFDGTLLRKHSVTEPMGEYTWGNQRTIY